MTTATIRAVVVVIVVTVVAIVALSIFSPGDNTGIILQIVGVVAPTTAALLALSRSSQNSEQISQTHNRVEELDDRVNGRLTQLVQRTDEAARAQGVHQGEQDERDRAGSVGPPL